jgi:trimethylamine--corrinoid protein Co-methyltransferase
MIISGAAQMARFYSLPSRGGGALTDTHLPDMQAGIESAFALLTAARNGINFLLHACGILNAFLAIGFEKFIIDEELCGMVKTLLTPTAVTPETLDFDTIKQVGIGGQFLIQPATVKLCRDAFFLPRLACRKSYADWQATGAKSLDETAATHLQTRLTHYEKPAIDEGLEQALSDFVEHRKAQ